MLGFLAHAATTDIRLTDAELEEARWVTREQLAAGEIGVPFEHSISFRLIEEWYDADARRPLREEPNVNRWGSGRT
jgi:NAD+ diphosphatase